MTAVSGEPRQARRVLKRQDVGAADQLARAFEIPHAMARVLSARGYSDEGSCREFLRPAPDSLHDPFEMAGMGAAVERLAASSRKGGRVVVFGDYDCDGVGAVAILLVVLRRLGADARPFIPHRLRDGYGLQAETIERAVAEHDPEGIVTVDCGITALEPITWATGRGLWVVVTDHHLPAMALPNGAVLVDPKLPGCRYPFKELCGAGIAWKVAEALLVSEGERVGIGERERRAWLGSLAKLAAVSTVADMVPLIGENRVLTSWGLTGLADPRSPGLAALMRRASIPAGRPPTTAEVAFRIAPRLNAAGRIDHAYAALELLTTTERDRAEELASNLERANLERREIQERVVDAVRRRLETSFDPVRDALVAEAGTPGEGWHRGVLGIAASKVAAEVRRPVLLVSLGEETAAGSARSWGTTPLFERLAPVARRHATHFGGHAKALGLTLPAGSWGAFREEARAHFAFERHDEEWVETFEVDADLAPGELDGTLAKALEAMEPHGIGNPRPAFLLKGLRWDGRGRPVGEKGLRVSFSSPPSPPSPSVTLDAVGWKLAERPRSGREGTYDVVANVTTDPFTRRPSLTVLMLERSA